MSNGGQLAIRGFLIQTLIALLNALDGEQEWQSVTLEPNIDSEKVDILWQYPGRIKAVQIKSSQNPFRKSDLESWAKELESWQKADEYELVLVGTPASHSVAGIRQIGKVTIPRAKNLDVKAFHEQAAHRLDRFAQSHGLHIDHADHREMLAGALAEKLVTHSTSGEVLTYGAFVKLLLAWISSGLRHPLNTTARPRLTVGGKIFVGRKDELAMLDAYWESGAAESIEQKINLVTIFGQGGEGKTSLVLNWYARIAADHRRSAIRVFEWSFYAQGTSDQRSANSDDFFDEALRFFGETRPEGLRGWSKGERLAALATQSRTLLILDGLEPLQHAVGPLAGRLKDDAMVGLLLTLASRNPGLCVVTSRQPLSDLARFDGFTSVCHTLRQLDEDAGVALLRDLRVAGLDWEIREVVTNEFKGHALALNLLGNYLREATADHDIRRWRDIRLLDQDDVEGSHARHVLLAYERWLGNEMEVRSHSVAGDLDQYEATKTWLRSQKDGVCCLAVLRILGLFDRSVDPAAFVALRAHPAIEGLTNDLVMLSDAEWNRTLTRLEDLRLITRDLAFAPTDNLLHCGIDCHPLIREYFAEQLRTRAPLAWKAAHNRLYEYLRDTTANHPDTPTGLLPLYHAVIHGCHAGRYQEALNDVYRPRIKRGADGYFSTRNLGLFGAELSILFHYFLKPWSQAIPAVCKVDQAWLYHEAGYDLQTQGRLAEALQPMNAALAAYTELSDWRMASICAGEQSRLQLSLGAVAEALNTARQGILLADKSGDQFQQSTKRSTFAHALHQAGQDTRAAELFVEAEELQAIRQPGQPLLYSLRGYQYCSLLLSSVERAVLSQECSPDSKIILSCEIAGISSNGTRDDLMPIDEAVVRCRNVCDRATTTLEWIQGAGGLLNVALGHLTIGHAMTLEARLLRCLHGGWLRDRPDASPLDHLNMAVLGLRNAGTTDDLPRGLLARADYHTSRENWDAADADLVEAQAIAERSGMRLYLADIFLLRAYWNFRRHKGALSIRQFPPELAICQTHLLAAKRLIEGTRYCRRNFEIAVLEQVFKVNTV